MENNTTKPQVLCIDFTNLSEGGVDTRILIPQSGKLGERTEHLLGSLRKFGEILDHETLGDYSINVMKKAYDTLYAAEVSCETDEATLNSITTEQIRKNMVTCNTPDCDSCWHM